MDAFKNFNTYHDLFRTDTEACAYEAKCLASEEMPECSRRVLDGEGTAEDEEGHFAWMITRFEAENL